MTRGVDEGDTAVLAVDLGADLVGTDVLRDAAGLARDDVRLADRVQQPGLTVVDVTHDGHDRRTGDQGLFAALVLAELDVEGLEQLAVLLLGADDLEDEVHLVREQPQRLVGDGLRRRDHLAEVHHHADERRRVRVDLLREVRERSTAGQPHSLPVAAGQHDAAHRRGLHGLVLLAPLPLRLTATTRRTAGTAERTLCATAATGAAGTATEAGTTAEAAAATGTTGTAAATGTGRTTGEAATAAATGTTGEAAAATGTTRTATGTAGTTATAAGTTATAGAAAGTRARSGTLRHHARVRTVTGGTAAGTRSLRAGHAARSGTGTALTLTTLRTRGAAGATALGTRGAGALRAATGARGATRTGRAGARHAGGTAGGEGVVARTGTGRTGAAGARGALARGTCGAVAATLATTAAVTLATVALAAVTLTAGRSRTGGCGTGPRGGTRGTRGLGLLGGSRLGRSRSRELGGRDRGHRGRLRRGLRARTGARRRRGGRRRGAARGLGLGRLGSRCAGLRGSGTCRSGRGGRCGLHGRRLAGRTRLGSGLAGVAAGPLQCVGQLTYNRRLDRRGRRTDEFTEFLELGHDDLALDAELLGEFVYPDLSHFAPFRSGLPPDRRYFMGVLIAYSSSAHRNLDLLPTREVPDRTGTRAVHFSYGATRSTNRVSAAVSNGPLALKARGNARRRTARSIQTGTGCT